MTEATTPLLRVQGLRMSVPNSKEHSRRPLLRGIDLDLAAGETLGLVGESGSGKSLTARTVLGLFPRGAQTEGAVRFDGRDVLTMPPAKLRAYRGKETAMVFQDARAHINPRQRIGDFLCEGMTVVLGLSRTEARSRATGLLERVGIHDAARRMRQRPHELSGGLLQRVMIASALAVRPRLLIADEPTTALDVSTQNDVLYLMKELQNEVGMALIMITHDLDVAAAVCDRTAVMYAGEIVETGGSEALHHRPRHPYTIGLIGARPDLERSQERLEAVPGRPISAFEAPPDACAFADRCAHATAVCAASHPVPVPDEGGWARCLRIEEVSAATATVKGDSGGSDPSMHSVRSVEVDQ